MGVSVCPSLVSVDSAVVDPHRCAEIDCTEMTAQLLIAQNELLMQVGYEPILMQTKQTSSVWRLIRYTPWPHPINCLL